MNARNEKKSILIAGITGFIGSILKEKLRGQGYRVFGLSRKKHRDPHILQCDLSDPQAVQIFKKKILQCQVIIQATPPINHPGELPGGGSATALSSADSQLIKIFETSKPHFIYISSVAVYGANRTGKYVTTRTKPHPADDYGERKLSTEIALRDSRIENYHIIRLAPVYNEQHLRNIAVRVFLPFTRIKIRLIPEPESSLCHTRTLAGTVIKIIEMGPKGGTVSNVCDNHAYRQNDLLKMFSGSALPFPVLLARPFYYFSYLLGKKKGNKLRFIYGKFFQNNLYR